MGVIAVIPAVSDVLVVHDQDRGVGFGLDIIRKSGLLFSFFIARNVVDTPCETAFPVLAPKSRTETSKDCRQARNPPQHKQEMPAVAVVGKGRSTLDMQRADREIDR